MEVKTKYNYGDLLYPITTRREQVKIFHNCPLCNDKGKVTLGDKEYTCPECSGYTYHSVDGEIEYCVFYKNGKVGSIQFEGYDKKYVDRDRLKISYMLDSTGVGSGTVWEEDRLFPTLEEAQAECDKCNKLIKESIK
jgi:Zn finger protein HypA/HybF involved in hydrogenase expression